MIHERFAERFEDCPAWIADHDDPVALVGRITSDNPRDGFVGDPDAGIYRHPTIVDGVRRDDEIYDRDVRAHHRRRHVLRLRRGDGAGERPRLRAVLGGLHERPEVGVPLPRAHITAVVGEQPTSGAEAHLALRRQRQPGNGSRQSGIWVLDQFTRWQSMNWDYAGKLQKAQMEVAEITGDSGYRLAWD